MQTQPVNENTNAHKSLMIITNLFLKATKLQDEVISGTRNTPSSSLAIGSSLPLFSKQRQKKIAKIPVSGLLNICSPWPIKHFLHFLKKLSFEKLQINKASTFC